jgi:hypothetical protein
MHCRATLLADVPPLQRPLYTRAAKLVAFRIFGEICPLLNRCVLPVYGDPTGQPFEIVFDTLNAALAHMERLEEADLDEFEGQ